jgi:hypothetical protein
MTRNQTPINTNETKKHWAYNLIIWDLIFSVCPAQIRRCLKNSVCAPHLFVGSPKPTRRYFKKPFTSRLLWYFSARNFSKLTPCPEESNTKHLKGTRRQKEKNWKCFLSFCRRGQLYVARSMQPSSLFCYAARV